MSKVSVSEVMEEILNIERESIKKRQNIVSANTAKFGRNKEDADVVNKILAIIEAGGIDDEN